MTVRLKDGRAVVGRVVVLATGPVAAPPDVALDAADRLSRPDLVVPDPWSRSALRAVA